jgi:hypothetical protein
LLTRIIHVFGNEILAASRRRARLAMWITTRRSNLAHAFGLRLNKFGTSHLLFMNNAG